MRKFYLLTFITFSFLVNLQAQNKYNLILFTEQGERFWLVLNGIRQNENPETNVKVTELNAPLYKAKIIFENKTLGELDKNVYMPEYAAEVTYSVKKGKKEEYVLRYVSDVPIAQARPPAPEQKVIVLTTTQPAIQQTVTVTEHTTISSPENTNISVGMNVGVPGVGINVNVKDNTGNVEQSTVTTHTTTTYSNTNTVRETQEPAYVLPGYSGPVGCPLPMKEDAFEAAKTSIAGKSFEDSKLTIAKQITDSNCLLSKQVKQVMNLFSFEDSKLEFAKYAYGRTFDLGNYYTVNDAFTFESSIDELNQHIKSQR